MLCKVAVKSSLDKKDQKMGKKPHFQAPKLDKLRGVDLARIYQVGESAISHWVSRDGCPRGADGTFNLSEVIKWREDRLRLEIDTVANAGGVELDRWRRMRADLVEIQLRRARGELLDRREVETGRVQRILVIKRAMLGLGRSIAPALTGMETREICAAIDDRIKQVVREFSGEPARGGDGRRVRPRKRR
jgi:hypothetical protein